MNTQAIAQIAALFGIAPEDMLSHSQSETSLMARHAICHAAHLRGWSKYAISKVIHRDSKAVANGIERAHKMSLTDPDFARMLNEAALIMPDVSGPQPREVRPVPQSTTRTDDRILEFVTNLARQFLPMISNLEIADRLGLTDGTVRASLAKMKKMGLLNTIMDGGRRAVVLPDGTVTNWSIRTYIAKVTHLVTAKIPEPIICPEPRVTCFNCGSTSLNPCRHLEAQGYRRAV